MVYVNEIEVGYGEFNFIFLGVKVWNFVLCCFKIILNGGYMVLLCSFNNLFFN